MLPGTDAPPKTEYEFERIGLRVGAKVAGRVEYERIGIEIWVMRNSPSLMDERESAEGYDEYVAHHMLAMMVAPLGTRYPMYSSSCRTECRRPCQKT